jgi:hypothetical protein
MPQNPNFLLLCQNPPTELNMVGIRISHKRVATGACQNLTVLTHGGSKRTRAAPKAFSDCGWRGWRPMSLSTLKYDNRELRSLKRPDF